MVDVVSYDGTPARWDDFVVSQPTASIEHTYGWRSVIEKAYGHRCHYLSAVQDGTIRGVLPLVHVRSLLFGNHLISMPFLDYGGILACDRNAAQALHDSAAALARELKVDDLIYRHKEPCGLDLPVFQGKVTFLLRLFASEEELWKAIPSERRNRVRKTQKLGLRSRFSGSDEVGIFYDIWSANMKDLGSPAHSREFFDEIFSSLGTHAELIFVDNDRGETVAGGLSLKFRDTVMLPWVSSRRKFFDLYPNNLLYWDLMAKACREGISCFDFGRSSMDSGTFQFKKRWKAEIVQLNWEYVPVSQGKVNFLTQDEKRFSPLISLWKRLPLFVANSLGPVLRKGIIN